MFIFVLLKIRSLLTFVILTFNYDLLPIILIPYYYIGLTPWNCTEVDKSSAWTEVIWFVFAGDKLLDLKKAFIFDFWVIECKGSFVYLYKPYTYCFYSNP